MIMSPLHLFFTCISYSEINPMVPKTTFLSILLCTAHTDKNNFYLHLNLAT